MKTLIAFTAAALISSPAFAWGEREQGALAGIAGTLLIQQIANQPRQPQQYYPQPQYQQPQVNNYYSYPQREVHIYPYQPTCVNQPIIDHRGHSIGYQTICR